MRRGRGWQALLAAALLAGGVAYARTAGTAQSPERPALQVADAHTALRARPSQTHPAARPVNHCARNHQRRLVIVSIRDQHTWFCKRGRTVYSSAVTTGRSGPDTRTPTGNFRIESRTRDTVLYPSDGGAYPVRYWITFDAPLYGFHDASWQHFRYGSPRYRTDGSHGCVHLPLKTIKFLYRWAPVGTPVAIH